MTKQVSVIIPARNEERTIQLLLEALLKQSYPKEDMEVIIADGLSEDKTRIKISEFSAQHPELSLRIVDNLKKTIPSGLNRAIEAAEGKILIRLDAHSIPKPDYIARCVGDLEAGLAENVGGVWEIKPQNESAMARGIAAAASHPLAVGGAKYRFSTKAEYVETVPFGAWKRETLVKAGGFDESLLTNEDYELNTRITQSGGRIYLDPQISTVYFSRPDLLSLAKQYWRYGYWKAQMIKRYPGSLKLRQALPPLLVAALLVLAVFALFLPFFRCLLLIALVLYLAILFVIGLQLACRKKDIMMTLTVPLAVGTMHFSWGAGFWVGLTGRKKTRA